MLRAMMLAPRIFFCLTIAFALAFFAPAPRLEAASACVWKVTSAKGGTLYLGGSVHALRGTDYPLPPAYNRAFDASSHLVFEVDEKSLSQASKMIGKAGEYPKSDSIKNHVDPRTYDYLRRVFNLMHVPETKWAKYRPWMLVLGLQSSGSAGFSERLGVEEFLLKRAHATSKTVGGLETIRQHAAVFSELSDRQAEAVLLLTFIPQTEGSAQTARVMQAWRRGDADSLALSVQESFHDYPPFGHRILDERNRRWIPEIEGFLASGKTYFVVAGAGHMGGPAGVVSLLRARGYQVEQL